jgi:hypothetical protein
MQRMHLGVVRLWDGLQGVAGMARLAAGLAPGFTAQVFGSRFGQAISGGRLVAVGAVAGLTVLQGAELLLQNLNLVFGRQELIHHPLGLKADLPQKLFPPA